MKYKFKSKSGLDKNTKQSDTSAKKGQVSNLRKNIQYVVFIGTAVGFVAFALLISVTLAKANDLILKFFIGVPWLWFTLFTLFFMVHIVPIFLLYELVVVIPIYLFCRFIIRKRVKFVSIMVVVTLLFLIWGFPIAIEHYKSVSMIRYLQFFSIISVI